MLHGKNKTINMKGSILILGLLLMSMLLLIGGVFLSLTLTYVKQFDIGAQELIAEYIARAGLHRILHDLRENYSDHDQQLIEVKFGQGKYKVGTVSLIGRGIHEILIVSKGEISGFSETQSHQMAIGGVVSVNIPTDYALFSDGDENIESLYGQPSFFCFGPIHVNGQLTIRLIMNEYMDSGKPKYIIILKPKEIRGPTITLKDRIIYKSIIGTQTQPQNFMWQYVKVIAGEGNIKGNTNNQIELDYTGIEWSKPPLIFGEAVGSTTVAYNSIKVQYEDKYPINLTNGEMSDITGDGILADGEHGGESIKILSWEDITYSYFQNWLDPNWYIQSSNFSNIVSTKIGICNDVIAKKDVLGYGRWDGNPGILNNSELYTFKYTPEDRIIKHVYYIKPASNTPKYSDGTPVISPQRDLDPRSTDKRSIIDDLLTGTPDDTFTASNGVLTIQNADQWKKHILDWWVPTNMGYYWSSDLFPNTGWLVEGENRFYLQNGGNIWFTRGPMAQDRELKAIRLALDNSYGILTYTENQSIDDFTVLKWSDFGKELDSNGTSHRIKVTLFPKTYYLSGDGTSKRFPLPRKYYWVDRVEFWNGSSWTTEFWNGTGWENRTEAPRYSGGNGYLFGVGDIKTVDSNEANNTANFGSYGFYRYWKQLDNTFYIEFGYLPPAGINNIRIRLGKWWFPTEPMLEIQQYPPKTDTMLLIDPYIQAVKIDLSKINLYTSPKNPRYPLGFLDYNNNGIKDEDEPYRPGIIYSKVPLVIEGTPLVPVVIVCEDDVYLKTINGNKPDDSSEAFPVAVITKKVAWVYHGDENTKSAREIILNKVIIFTQGEQLYEIGGKGLYWGGLHPDIIANKTKLIGSLVKMKKDKKGLESSFISSAQYSESANQVFINKKEMLNPYIYIFDDREYRLYEIPIQIKYPISFRTNVPPYMPVEIKIRSIKQIRISNVDEYFTKLLGHIKNKQETTSEIYQSLINEIQ